MARGTATATIMITEATIASKISSFHLRLMRFLRGCCDGRTRSYRALDRDRLLSQRWEVLEVKVQVHDEVLSE